MRTTQLALALTLALTGACKWTDFDDLSDTTWAHSQEDPDVGSTNYGIAIAGITQGGDGGSLAVLGDDVSTFSTIEYDAKGGSDLGPNTVKLGSYQIGLLGENPVFVASSTGDRVAVIARSLGGGSYAIASGSAANITGTDLMATVPSPPPPDDAMFTSGNDLIFGAGDSLYTVPAMGTTTACKATDNADVPMTIAALTILGTDVWVWTKTGSLWRFPIASLSGCTAGVAIKPAEISTWTAPANFMAAMGSHIHVVGNFFVLTSPAAGPADSGSVFVVNPTSGQQASTMLVNGLKASTLFQLDGTTYLVAGRPAVKIDGLNAGEVDLHAIDATTGVIDATPALQLHDAQPESGQQFGRAVATMQFNGKPIIVVGADAEVFAYYRTALYSVAH